MLKNFRGLRKFSITHEQSERERFLPLVEMTRHLCGCNALVLILHFENFAFFAVIRFSLVAALPR